MNLRDEVVGGSRQQPRGFVVLLQRAAPEHRDLVGELERLVDVVRDEHDRLAQFALQTQYFVLQLVADHRVDGGERLVHQQDRRIGGQRARHADALLLTAGELRRVAGGELGVQPDAFEHLVGGLAGRPAGLALQHRNRRDVVDHPLVRHQPRVLDDVADSEAQLDRVDACDTSAPSTVMVPEVGSIIRLIIRSAVVLPLPDEPTKTVNLPSGTSRLSWSTAVVPSAKTLLTLSKMINCSRHHWPIGWLKPLSRTQFRAAWSGSMPELPDTAALSAATPAVVSFADTASSTSLSRSDFFCEFTSGTMLPARKLCSGSSSDHQVVLRDRRRGAEDVGGRHPALHQCAHGHRTAAVVDGDEVARADVESVLLLAARAARPAGSGTPTAPRIFTSAECAAKSAIVFRFHVAASPAGDGDGVGVGGRRRASESTGHRAVAGQSSNSTASSMVAVDSGAK